MCRRRHMRTLLCTGLIAAVACLLAGALPAAAATAISSSNWAGYAAHSTTYTSVTASWMQPSISCPSAGNYQAFWVGLDGYSSASTEQAGTGDECAGASPDYYAWYDLYPADPVYLSKTVQPDDSMTATVSATTKDLFTITIHDATQGWTFTTQQSDTAASRSSAEVIVEVPNPPSLGTHTVTFTGAHVNGGTLGASDPTLITSPGVSCGSITNGGTEFSCTW
jgi:Peptidase A4 family